MPVSTHVAAEDEEGQVSRYGATWTVPAVSSNSSLAAKAARRALAYSCGVVVPATPAAAPAVSLPLPSVVVGVRRSVGRSGRTSQ